MKRPRVHHLLLVALLLLAVGLVLGQGRRVREDRAEVLAALRAAAGPQLPAAAAAGAEEATAPARYARESLHDLVNGAAEGYLARGFERCVASVYGFGGGVEVAAEAHRSAAAEGARAQMPWAMGTPCIVCEEHCPTDPKAIWLERGEERTRQGKPVTLARPRVEPSRCVGCGICENRCPVGEEAAIRVSSVGESRDPLNRMLLGR